MTPIIPIEIAREHAKRDYLAGRDIHDCPMAWQYVYDEVYAEMEAAEAVKRVA